MQMLPEQPKRIETGAVQFGDDWPGVFIRGDNAAYFAHCIDLVLSDTPDVLAEASLSGLADLLRSSTVK